MQRVKNMIEQLLDSANCKEIRDGKNVYVNYVHMSSNGVIWVNLSDLPCPMCERMLRICLGMVGLKKLTELPFITEDFNVDGAPSSLRVDLFKGMRLVGISRRKTKFRKKRV